MSPGGQRNFSSLKETPCNIRRESFLIGRQNGSCHACDVVFITGTAFINKTIDHLLDLCSGRVAIIGPSTPLWPELLNGLGSKRVAGLFGLRVCDPELVYQIVSEGGSTGSFLKKGTAKAVLISLQS